MATRPARPHRRLIWKYTAVVVGLVAAATISVGLTELYFTSQDIKRAVTRVERDKASSAALSIEQLTTGLLRQLESVAQPTVGTGPAGLEERNQDFQRVLEREPLISRLTYLDGDGKERLSVSPLEPVSATAASTSRGAPCFVRARANEQYLGPVRFVRQSQPHMTVSVSEGAPGRGVIVADLDFNAAFTTSSSGREWEPPGTPTPSTTAASS